MQQIHSPVPSPVFLFEPLHQPTLEQLLITWHLVNAYPCQMNVNLTALALQKV